MHILDIVQNSISAGATIIEILIRIDTVADRLAFAVKDDGCGMSEEMVARVISPFTTSRTTRKVGLGIPLIKQLADMTNGHFALQSRVGEGTVLQAEFQLSQSLFQVVDELFVMKAASGFHPGLVVVYAIQVKRLGSHIGNIEI